MDLLLYISFCSKNHRNIIIGKLSLVIYNAVNNGWMLIYNFDLGGNII